MSKQVTKKRKLTASEIMSLIALKTARAKNMREVFQRNLLLEHATHDELLTTVVKLRQWDLVARELDALLQEVG